MARWTGPAAGGAVERRERAISATVRPFRFTLSMPRLAAPVTRWRDQLRRIEDHGFSSVSISDHLGGGWTMDPVVAMTVAAEATTALRVLALVFCNDFRHPAMLHRSVANLDVVSEGRVEIGLGAGWQAADYQAAGLPFAEPGVRLARLAESIDVLTGLFAGGPLTYDGAHYRVTGLPGLPRPVQHPHPPLLVGGGSRRILELAGRVADIAGINPRLAPDVDPQAAAVQLSPQRVGQLVGWARAAAASAGRAPDALELQQTVLDLRLRHRGVEHRATSSLAQRAPAEALAGSPAALHGDLDQCVDTLLERRERYGISYLHLGNNLAAAAPIVARLAGR